MYFEGPNGLERRTADIPAALLEAAKAKRHELLEAVSNVDDELADVFLADQEPSVALLKAAIRRATLSLKFVPLMMGSAYKNKGIQVWGGCWAVIAIRISSKNKGLCCAFLFYLFV